MIVSRIIGLFISVILCGFAQNNRRAEHPLPAEVMLPSLGGRQVLSFGKDSTSEVRGPDDNHWLFIHTLSRDPGGWPVRNEICLADRSNKTYTVILSPEDMGVIRRPPPLLWQVQYAPKDASLVFETYSDMQNSDVWKRPLYGGPITLIGRAREAILSQDADGEDCLVVQFSRDPRPDRMNPPVRIVRVRDLKSAPWESKNSSSEDVVTLVRSRRPDYR